MPIAMSRAELARIKRWTDADREDPEAAQKRELIRQMNETSKEMTKNWPNSLENVNKRNEEVRRARIAVAEQANSKFYKRYVKRRKEEQERLMYSARDTIFKNKDAPKLLLSAVIETVVQKDRMEQVKFNRELKQAAAERKRKDDDEIIRKAKEWEDVMAQKQHMRFEIDKKYQEEIVNQANEVAERNRREYETELEMQKFDNMIANQQIEAIKEFDEKFKEAEKVRIWADIERAKREVDARRAEQEARDKMDDRLMDVLLRSKNRVEQKRRQTEKRLKDEKLRVLQAISARLQSGDEARAAREQEILDKTNRERDAIVEARQQATVDKLAADKERRVLQHQQWQRDEAARLGDLGTATQWECMNRFKNLELYDDFKEKLAEEKARKIKEFREDILRQWKEREDRDAKERADTRYFYGELAEKRVRAADNRLLTHAAALLAEAHAHARPDYALHKTIDRYCAMYRLYPMADLPKSLKEHFQHYAPRDGSAPDPQYAEPPRPRAPAPRGEPGPRGGLQDPAPAQPSASPNKVKEETVADYKRKGRANGLQRRDAQIDLHLPPISVTPCKTEGCSCPLKK